MRSVPATSLDLTDPAFVADPYPFFAEERRRAPVAWHEQSGTYLTFDHPSASKVQRTRDLQRLWRDREPASYLEPFNLLHRNQMMENEPPEHTRLRAGPAAFNRGHIERLRPRVRAGGRAPRRDRPAGFDAVEDFAEPLPVLVIAELLGVRARARPRPPPVVAGDRADVRGVALGRSGRRGRRRGRRLRRAGAGIVVDRRATRATT
jgi:unspecific monooxygenase